MGAVESGRWGVDEAGMEEALHRVFVGEIEGLNGVKSDEELVGVAAHLS